MSDEEEGSGIGGAGCPEAPRAEDGRARSPAPASALPAPSLRVFVSPSLLLPLPSVASSLRRFSAYTSFPAPD
jgi:hypothetical protein